MLFRGVLPENVSAKQRSQAEIMIPKIMSDTTDFQSLIDYLTKTPAIVGPIGSGVGEENLWWVKFIIDVDHPLAWRVVQELGHV